MAGLKGNTLIETLVALVILVFCSVLGTSIYLNILDSQGMGQKLRACYLSRELAQQSVLKKDFLDATVSWRGITIAKTCKPYNGSTGLVNLTIVAKDEDGKTLWEQNEIVVNETAE